MRIKGHKFRAKRTSCGLHSHPSRKEAIRCSELQALEKGHFINRLEFQPRLTCKVNGIKVCDYVADFSYFDREGQVWEDVKGVRTPIYRLKKKLVKACLGIDIKET